MSFYTNYVGNRNQDMKVAFTTADAARSLVQQQGYQDYSTLQELFDEDPLANHLGLISQFGEQGDVSVVPFYQDALSSGAILEVNGWEGKFHYDLPIETDNRTKTTGDTSDQPLAGIDGTTFQIILNKEFAPNTTLTANAIDDEGMTIVVSDAEPVQAVSGGFLHTVVLGTNDPEKTYDLSLLKSDVTYIDTGHGVAEYGEKLALAHLDAGANTQTFEFQIGSPMGAETFYTGKANEMDLSGITRSRDLLGEVDDYSKKGMDIAFLRQNLPGGRTVRTVATMMQMLTVKKFNTLMSRSLMWQRGFTLKTEKGILRYNEGLWHQMRRGFILTYPKRMGMRPSHLGVLSDYVFKQNPTMEPMDRVLRFKTGTELGKNFEMIYQNEFNEQINRISPLLGSDRAMSTSPVSGTWDALVLKPVKVKSVYLPGIGQVEHTVDKGLDYAAHGLQDRRFQGANANGFASTTYSGIMWDVTDQAYSNNGRMPAGVTNIGGNDRANIHLVVPKGDKVFWGTENGRYSSKSAKDIVASRKTMTESFFIYGSASTWMRDPSKFAMIELAKEARRGYN